MMLFDVHYVAAVCCFSALVGVSWLHELSNIDGFYSCNEAIRMWQFSISLFAKAES